MRVTTVLPILLLLGILPTQVGASWTERVSTLIRNELESIPVTDPVQPHFVLSSSDRVLKLYQSSDFAPLWSRAGVMQPQARELVAIVRSTWRDGLDPRSYPLASAEQLIHHADDHAERLAQADVMLTDILVRYAGDLLRGRLSDSALRKREESDPEQLDLASLASAVRTDTLDDFLSGLAPQSLAYVRLRDALLHYRALQEQGISSFYPPQSVLKNGDTGTGVKSLRQRLVFLQDLEKTDVNEDLFDGVVEQALIQFQMRHGLDPDGIAGPETLAALAVPLANRISQIEYNLERWRWLPRILGRRYVVVNIAGFTLEVVEGDNLVLQMRVIVGKPFQQTPVFSSKITHLTLNPFWEVPYSIATKEILPKLRQDPDYLHREHMRVLRLEKGQVREVDPANIDWAAVGRVRFPYRFRQDPGPANALGQVKFYLPNRYNVYLHDTPNKSLFSQAVRCLSHGCVRLEKPLELAAYLLHDKPEWTQARIIETLDHERNYRVMLTVPIPIYTVYWTAWVDSQGILNFRNDVYGRDKRLNSTLTQANAN